jgi:basic amino acid/polyamine antiporter, APA family
MPAVRQLGLTSATALVVASMIGSGVFTTSGFLLADLRSRGAVLLVWVVGGIVAALGALSYGALARRIPESGGEYLFLSRTLHPAAGYFAGWISLLVGFSAPLAAVAFAFGEYARPWLPEWKPKLTGSLLMLLFSGIHAAHIQRGASMQNLAVAVKLVVIVLFICFAFTRLPPPSEATWSAAPLSAFGVSLVWVSFSYSGWNAAVYVGGEIRNPERNLPWSLLMGAGLVTLIYLALNTVFLFAAPVEQLSGKLDVGRIAAEALGGPRWGNVMAVMVCLALMTSVSSLLMAGPRVYARMAADGFLPRWLAPQSGPPRAAILFQLIVALIFLWSAAYQSLLTYIGFTLGLSTGATVLGLVVLRRREGERLPVCGWPWVPGLFLLSITAMTIFAMASRPMESLIGLATLGVGWMAWWWKYARATPHRQQQP